MSLRNRIAAVASLSVALAVIAAAVGLYAAVRADLRGEIDTALRARAGAFAPPPRQAQPAAGASRSSPQGLFGSAVPAPAPAPRSPGAPAGDDNDYGRVPGTVQPAPFGAASGYVQFVDPDGQVFVPGGQGTSPVKITATASDRAIAARGTGSSLTDRTVNGTKLRVLALGTGTEGAIVVARPLTEVENELSRLLLILALIGGGGIVLAGLLGMVVARTALAPIALFTRRTETLTGRMDLSRRLEVRGRDELARLAESFNDTLDALERSVAAQRNLIADASHELRTPISSLRANIQILGESDRLPPAEQESLRRDIIDELDELTALVEDVVELARGADPEGTAEDVRLDELVEAAVQSARRRSDLRFEVHAAPTIVRGRAERISRAVSNVVDNARKWSPPAGVVEVSVAGGVLEVRDHGPGFSDQDLPHVFDRFYRAQDARGLPGSGLGLAIVRQAADSCGGFAQALNADGGGALVRVGFGDPVPMAPSQPQDALA